MQKLKILVSCYACSPFRGSEPGMGWSFVKGISDFHEVHVLVEQLKWESDIHKYLDEHPELKANLKFYDIKKKRRKRLRKIWPPSYYWFYKQWQQKAYQLAVKLHETEHFDLVHQLNMVGFREPGYLWKLAIPFVWGPIGGMENTNFKLLFNLPFKDFVFYSLRNLINTYQKSILIRPKKAAKRLNSMLISATEKNQLDIKKYWGVDSILIPEVGQYIALDTFVSKRKKTEPLKIIWSGQHTGGKALNILLKSLALLDTDINWELKVLGVGNMTKRWQSLSENLNIAKKCHWHGWIEKDKALAIMQTGHVLCITSIKDLTSTVTLEGLSLGLPIITIDHCGFSNVINDTCGIKIPIAYTKELSMSFKNGIEKLYHDEALRYKLAEGALKRSKDFSWDKKIMQLNNIYTKLLREDTTHS